MTLQLQSEHIGSENVFKYRVIEWLSLVFRGDLMAYLHCAMPIPRPIPKPRQ